MFDESTEVYPATFTYAAGTTVELAAIPSNSYRFVSWTRTGWDGTSMDTNETISIEMIRDEDVMATFVPITYYLSTNISPEIGGQVTLEPAQPTEGYIVGTKVTLHATPNDGYRFEAWGGDISGEGSKTTVVIDGDNSITATFAEKSSTAVWVWIGGIAVIILAGFLLYFFVFKKR